MLEAGDVAPDGVGARRASRDKRFLCLVWAKDLDVAMGSDARTFDSACFSEMRALQAQFDDTLAGVGYAVPISTVPESCRVRLCLEVAG